MGRPEMVWKRMSRSREAEGAFMKGVRRTGCPAHRVLLETNHRRFRHIESPPCRGLLSAEWLSGISHAHDQKVGAIYGTYCTTPRSYKASPRRTRRTQSLYFKR